MKWFALASTKGLQWCKRVNKDDWLAFLSSFLNNKQKLQPTESRDSETEFYYYY